MVGGSCLTANGQSRPYTQPQITDIGKMVMNTLVIVSHPYPERSRIINALQLAAEATENIAVRNLESLYGNAIANFDIKREQDAAEKADRIVFLFPIHWFNLTPMLKAYLNEVWTFGWAFGPGGDALKGKEMLVVVSAGASDHTYSHEGLVQSSLEEVLTPMKASALYVGMKYLKPLTLTGAGNVSDESLSAFQDKFSAALKA